MSAIDPRADRVGHSNTVLRALGQIRNELEYRPISEILERAAAAHGARAEGHARGIRGDPASASSRRRPSRAGSERSREAPRASSTPPGFRYQRRRLGVVQRGADAAELDRQPVRAELVARHRAVDVRQPVRRLLRHAGRGVRRALAARGAHHHGALARRGAPAPASTHADITWDQLARRDRALDRDGRAARPDAAARARIPRSPSSRGRSPAQHDHPGGAAHEICDGDRRRRRVHARHHGRALDGRRGVGGAQGRLPGHRPPHARRAARGRHPGPLRVGLPAPAAETPTSARPVTGESHAWVEWFAGEWQGFDPTNNIDIGDRHVLVGRGRDYNDVPPLRGVYAGPVQVASCT